MRKQADQKSLAHGQENSGQVIHARRIPMEALGMIGGSVQFHRGIGLFGDQSRQGVERGFEDAVDGEFMEFVQRQVHELGKITLDHQTLADQAAHHVAHRAELAQRHQ